MSDINMSTFNDYVACVAQDIVAAYCSPHVLMKPKVYKDGNQWCALYGENIQEGVVGFGDTPELACKAFDLAWEKG